MARNETIIQYLQEDAAVQELTTYEERRILSRVLSYDAVDFVDLTKEERREFDIFAFKYFSKINHDHRCSELSDLLAERLLYTASHKALNDVAAHQILISASAQGLLVITEDYESDTGTARKKRTVQRLVGTLPQEIQTIADSRDKIPPTMSWVPLFLVLALLLGSAAVFALNLFVPSVSQVLTQEKLKLLYTLIIGAASAITLGAGGFGFVIVGWLIMATVGSFMFNMIPVEVAMKVHSLAANAWVFLLAFVFLKAIREEYAKDGKQNREMSAAFKREKRKLKRYVNKMIRTLQKGIPMRESGFRNFTQERKQQLREYLDDYCVKLKEELKKLDKPRSK